MIAAPRAENDFLDFNTDSLSKISIGNLLHPIKLETISLKTRICFDEFSLSRKILEFPLFDVPDEISVFTMLLSSTLFKSKFLNILTGTNGNSNN